MRYKLIGYNIYVMRQSACLIINPITVASFAPLFNCGWSSIRLNDWPNINLVDIFKLIRTGLSLMCCLLIRNSTGGFHLLEYFSGIVSHPGVLQVPRNVFVESSSLIHHRSYS